MTDSKTDKSSGLPQGRTMAEVMRGAREAREKMEAELPAYIASLTPEERAAREKRIAESKAVTAGLVKGLNQETLAQAEADWRRRQGESVSQTPSTPYRSPEGHVRAAEAGWIPTRSEDLLFLLFVLALLNFTGGFGYGIGRPQYIEAGLSVLGIVGLGFQKRIGWWIALVPAYLGILVNASVLAIAGETISLSWKEWRVILFSGEEWVFNVPITVIWLGACIGVLVDCHSKVLRAALGISDSANRVALGLGAGGTAVAVTCLLAFMRV